MIRFLTDWSNIACIITVVFSLLAMFMSVARAVPLWAQFNSIDKDFWWAFNAACVFFIESAIEQMVTGKSSGPSTIFACILSIVFFRAARRRRNVFTPRMS